MQARRDVSEPVGSMQGIEASLTQLRDLGIALSGTSEIRDYLSEHPDLLEPLQATAVIAGDRFPAGTQFSLSVYHDPEIDDEYLAIYARPPELGLSMRATFDDVARRRAPLLRGRSGRVLVLPDYTGA